MTLGTAAYAPSSTTQPDMTDVELMNVVTVGGNSVSAFLSWRLQATNACDVTLVWKTGFEHVSQYGISFKSPVFGNERFKPHNVVRAPEDAAASRRDHAFDYVILCIKALPDVYDLASVIDSVVTPQHTCILVNTTHSLGLESAIEERFPTNVVLSLVCGADLTQLGGSEFEHRGSTEVWVGPANRNSNIPSAIQDDMAQALAMTLSTGQVDCKVSSNIRQQQYERVIGSIAFHPLTVLYDTPSYAALLDKVGVPKLVSDVIDELLALAEAQGCKFPAEFRQMTIDEYARTTADNIMWQDYTSRRPMEVETYLGSPIRLSLETGVPVPRIETLYSILHNLNVVNRSRPKADVLAPQIQPGSPSNTPSPLPRMSSQGPMRSVSNGIPNGNGMGPPPRPRPRGASQHGPPPGMRRGPPMNGGPSNGYGRPPPNGMPMPPSRQQSRRGSMEAADLEEFSHLVVYDDIPEAGEVEYPPLQPQDLLLKERELQLRQRELALKEHELRLRRAAGGPPPGPGPRRGPPPPQSIRHNGGVYDDDDDDDDYFDPSSAPPASMIDPDNFDMMSVTSRKNRKAPSSSAQQLRKNPERDSNGPQSRGSRFRPSFGRNRTSQVMASVPGLHDNILDDPLMGFTSNRYGAVDRGMMHQESRANSLTASRLDELQYTQGPPTGMNGNGVRRASQSPGNPYSPSIRGGGNGRPSPPNGYAGPHMNGRPSPPDGVRQPVPRYPPGHGNAVAPQEVEQHAGVSALQPPKTNFIRSLTGSASASAGSGDSTNLDSEPSAHSSQSSLGPRPHIGVR
ncbi:2-dehydropantoate 2-reductase-like protein [Bombardia bombarda]|uniref:2-dehydropantoate 2-reductase-like protein n=1 Tax=Bombardia bombarda TaxID=252184 RepID=A0AA39WI10_9PEZI|nr:2-dehydropantoate 2-reductase-like protein [Bombardia bombarda]